MPGDEEKRQHLRRGWFDTPDHIATPSESALAVGDRGANVGAERTGATLDAPGRDEVQVRSRGVEKTPTTITATVTPPQQFVGRYVTIAGQLTSGGGADIVGVPVVLYNTDDPTKKVRTATATTDASGRYQFTLTDNVATTHAYTLCAEGRSAYSRAQSTDCHW